MERPIKEDPKLAHPAQFGFIAFTISEFKRPLLFLVFVFCLYFAMDPAWATLLTGLAFVTGAVLLSSVVIRSVERDRAAAGEGEGSSWMLRDDGLQRVYLSGQRETIRWEQIRNMKWFWQFGLIVRFEDLQTEHDQRCPAFRSEMKWDPRYNRHMPIRQYRAKLNVQKDQARELIAAMRSKTGWSDAQVVPAERLVTSSSNIGSEEQNQHRTG